MYVNIALRNVVNKSRIVPLMTWQQAALTLYLYYINIYNLASLHLGDSIVFAILITVQQ